MNIAFAIIGNIALIIAVPAAIIFSMTRRW